MLKETHQKILHLKQKQYADIKMKIRKYFVHP